MGIRFFDKYSILHFSVGSICFFWNISLQMVIILHTCFELFENSNYGMRIINNFYFWPGGKESSDSLENILGDTFFVIMGWLISYYISLYVPK